MRVFIITALSSALLGTLVVVAGLCPPQGQPATEEVAAASLTHTAIVQSRSLAEAKDRIREVNEAWRVLGHQQRRIYIRHFKTYQEAYL